MHRFFVPPDSWNPGRPELGAAETHHARDVLRLSAGDRVALFNGRGAEATAQIVSFEKDRTLLKALAVGATPPLRCRIALAQAIPKGRNMDLIVQKATELGAAAIVPLVSDRAISRPDEEDGDRKAAKWRQVAIEAAKQCGQNWLPDVSPPQTPKAFFAALPKYDLMLIASLQPDARPFKRVVAEHVEANGLPRSALVLVGPEGDFTPAEAAMAKAAGCRPVTLGPIVLRTETAAIYCLSVLAYELLAG